MNLKTRRKLFWLSVLGFLAIAPPAALYATGWRVASDFTVKRIGGLFIAVPESGSGVLLDGKLIKNTNFLQSGVFIQNLTPGSHTIMVSKEGFWPWAKKLMVEESAVTEAKAFTLSQAANGKVLLKGQFEAIYASDKNSVLILEEQKNGALSLNFYMPSSEEFLSPANSASKKLLTNKTPLKSVTWEDGSANLFFKEKTVSLAFDFSKRAVLAKVSSSELGEDLNVLPHRISVDYRKKAEMRFDDKSVWVNWLSTPLPYFLSDEEERVFQTKSVIRGASFFPKRSDVALVAYENGVFALEIDGRGNRNIQPVYKGKEPLFAVLENEIYILDRGILAKMEL